MKLYINKKMLYDSNIFNRFYTFAESLTSISNKNHDMIRKPRSLYQNTEYENNNTICLTAGCIRAGKHSLLGIQLD